MPELIKAKFFQVINKVKQVINKVNQVINKNWIRDTALCSTV